MYTQAHSQRPVGFWACHFQQHILGAHIREIISQIPTDTSCTLTRPVHPSPSLPPQLPSLSLILTMLLSGQCFPLSVSTSEREHSILLFLCLPYFPQHAAFRIHVIAQMTELHFFFMVEYHPIMCVSYFLFHSCYSGIHSSIDGYLCLGMRQC